MVFGFPSWRAAAVDATEAWPCSWDAAPLEIAPRAGAARSRRNRRKRIARTRLGAAAPLPPSAAADRRFAFFPGRDSPRTSVESAGRSSSRTRSRSLGQRSTMAAVPGGFLLHLFPTPVAHLGLVSFRVHPPNF